MLEFTVPNMSCGHCASTITQAIRALDADARVTIAMPEKRVVVESDLGAEALRACLTQAGYVPA